MLGSASSCNKAPQGLAKLIAWQKHEGDRGLSAHTFSQRQITYHLLGDLLAILQVHFRWSLYDLVST